MKRQHLVGLAWLLGTLALALSVAAGVPFFARRVPWPVERALGRFVNPRVSPCEGTASSRAALAALVERLYPRYPEDSALPITVDVVHGKTVNAFATLGGRVHVYDGLLQQARSPEELAGVLAHEMEHVRRRHVVEGVASRLITFGAFRLVFSGGAPVARTLVNMSYSRAQEKQADEGGLQRLRNAHIDPRGFADFFERASNASSLPSLLSDHPASEDRAALARRYAGGPVEPVMSATDWKTLQAICR